MVIGKMAEDTVKEYSLILTEMYILDGGNSAKKKEQAVIFSNQMA